MLPLPMMVISMIMIMFIDIVSWTNVEHVHISYW